MSALVYISKDLSSMRRAKSSCGRCSSGRDGRDSRQTSPGRATYLPSEKGRNLSLEIDGRQSRTSRRSASIGRDKGEQRNGRSSRAAAYCFVVPYANGAPAVTSPTTYTDDYKSPFAKAMSGRRDRTTSPAIPSSRSTHNFRSTPSPSHFSSSSSSSILPSSNSFHSSMSRSTTPTQSRSHYNNNHHNGNHYQQQQQQPPRPKSAMTRSATVDNTFGGNKTTYMDHFSWGGYGTQV